MRLLLAGSVLLTVMACETITEVRYISCETMELFPNDSIPTVADSVRFSNCSEAAWNGTTIRRKP